MYSTSTAYQQIVSLIADIGTLIGVTIAAVVVAWVALTGLRFALRKISHYVTGKKF